MADTKWPTFHRWDLQRLFHEWKLLNYKWYLIEMCSLGSNWQYVIIGSDNGLVPDRQQTIIWTNNGLDYWRIYASFGLNELTWQRHQMETFSTLLAICEGNYWPLWGQWCGALMFSLIYIWTNGWASNGGAGDLRCHHTHYDITVIH